MAVAEVEMVVVETVVVVVDLHPFLQVAEIVEEEAVEETAGAEVVAVGLVAPNP